MPIRPPVEDCRQTNIPAIYTTQTRKYNTKEMISCRTMGKVNYHSVFTPT
jgi:hypothetical protein